MPQVFLCTCEDLTWSVTSVVSASVCALRVFLCTCEDLTWVCYQSSLSLRLCPKNPFVYMWGSHLVCYQYSLSLRLCPMSPFLYMWGPHLVCYQCSLSLSVCAPRVFSCTCEDLTWVCYKCSLSLPLCPKVRHLGLAQVLSVCATRLKNKFFAYKWGPHLGLLHLGLVLPV